MADWVVPLVAAVAGPLVASLVTFFATRWWERRRRVAWEIEHLTGDDWTLTRSGQIALDVKAYPHFEITDPLPSNGLEWGRGLDRVGRLYVDMKHGDSVKVHGVERGWKLRIDWIEHDRRWTAEVLLRNGRDEYTVYAGSQRRRHR